MLGQATGSVILLMMHKVYWLRKVQFLRESKLIILYRVLVQRVSIVCARFLDLVQVFCDGIMQ